MSKAGQASASLNHCIALASHPYVQCATQSDKYGLVKTVKVIQFYIKVLDTIILQNLLFIKMLYT